MSVVPVRAAGDDEGQVTKEANQRYGIAFSSDPCWVLGLGKQIEQAAMPSVMVVLGVLNERSKCYNGLTF